MNKIECCFFKSTPCGPRYYRVTSEGKSMVNGIYIAHIDGGKYYNTEINTGLPMNPRDLDGWTEIAKTEFEDALIVACAAISERA